MENREEKTDTQLRNDILSELQYEPTVKQTDIGVLVKNGTVTLLGDVSTYFEKWDALRAAKRVSGVRAIADEIKVIIPNDLRYTDGDIASAVASQIGWCSKIPEKSVMATVQEGWVTLEGEVEWKYQKNTAENIVEHLHGVKGVTNSIKIKPSTISSDIKAAITLAFERSALVDANKIQVETVGDKVTLHGKVRSHTELEEAERVAWAAAGVSSVDNQLKVKWSWFSD